MNLHYSWFVVKLMKWGRTRGSPHHFRHLFDSCLLWKCFSSSPLFLNPFFLPTPSHLSFCTGTCCRDLPPKKALLCSLYFQFHHPCSHSLAVSAVNISIKPALALRCALSLSVPHFPAQHPGADNTGTASPYLLRNDTLGSCRVKRRFVLLLSDPQTGK